MFSNQNLSIINPSSDILDSISISFDEFLNNKALTSIKQKRFFDIDSSEFPLKTYKINQNIEIRHKYIYHLVTNTIGFPSCIQISRSIIIIGTLNGFIFTYNLETDSHSLFFPFSLDYKDKIVSIDISYDHELIISATFQGLLHLYDYNTTKIIKTINLTYPIYALKFYHKTNKSISKSRIILSGEGKVLKLIFSRNIFKNYDVETSPIIEKTSNKFIQIEVFKSSTIDNEEFYQLIAIASISKICILQIEPKNLLILVIQSPNNDPLTGISPISPTISWDEGFYRAKEGVKCDKSPFLTICWEKSLVLVNLNKKYSYQDESFIYEGNLLGRLSVSERIIWGGFISYAILVIFNEKNEVFTVNIDDFESEEKLFNYNGLEIGNWNLKYDEENSIKSYKNYFSISKETNLFYFIEKDDNFLCFELYSPKTLINKLILSGEWSLALLSSIYIYQKGGNLIVPLANLPKFDRFRHKSMQKYLEDLLLSYIKFILTDSESLNMGLILEFLDIIDSLPLVFNEIFPLYKTKKKLNDFFKDLHFYLGQKILSTISEEALLLYIEYLKNDNKFELIEKIITNLDFNKIDFSQLIGICMEFNLFRPLILISTVYNNDFLTPLIKIFSFYKENKNFETGILLLWYLNICFQGENPKKEKIKEQELNFFAENISWIFDINNLKIIIEIEPKIFFQIIAKITNIVNVSNVKNILSVVIQTDKELFENNENYQKNGRFWLFWLFLQFFQKQIEIPQDQKPFYSIFFIENEEKFNFFWMENIENNLLNLEKNIILLKIIGNFRNYPENELKNLKNKLDELNKFALVLSQLIFWESEYLKSNEYIKSGEILINSKNPLFIANFFQLINDFPLDLKKTINFKIFIIENIEILLKNDIKSSQLLIKTYLNEYKLSKIVQKIDKNLLLEYLNHIFSVKYEKANDEDVLILHLELLISLFTEEKVIFELKQRDYPIENALLICEKNNFLKTKAFLLSRCGAIQKAMDIYKDLAWKTDNYESFKDIFNDIYELVKKNENKEIWEYSLLILFELATHKYNEIFKIIENLIEEISDYIDFLTMFKLFLQFNNLKMGEIGGILSKFKEIKEKNIKKLEFSREFFRKDVKKLLLDLQNENTGRFLSKPFCENCYFKENNSEKTNEKTVVFRNCHHFFHQKCIESNECDKCRLIKGEQKILKRFLANKKFEKTIKNKEKLEENVKINPKLSKKRIINVLNIWENNLLKENEEKGKIENIYSSTFDL